MLTGDLDCDCEILLEQVKKMKLHKATNRKPLNSEGKAPTSDVYGLTTWQRYSNLKSREKSEYPGWYLTKLKTQYPDFQQYLDEFSYYHLPEDFKWTSVVINKNFKCLRHKDASNVGTSWIVGIGDYKNGETIVENKNGTTTFHKIRHNPVGFNGSELYHYVAPWQGERWTLVFYNNLN